MPNIPLNKGKKLTVKFTVTKYDGTPDLTTPATLVPAPNGLLNVSTPTVDPITGQRTATVTVPSALTTTQLGVTLNVSATIAGDHGAGPVTKSQSLTPVDVIVPPDLRSLVAAYDPPNEEPI